MNDLTYRELLDQLTNLTEDQLDLPVMLEGGEYGLEGGECRPAEFLICGPSHDHLADFYPVLYVR